jgi:succinate dehydrogenase flavin-adding protein (antitoxin of CptAB toxin-antitoxin module)
MAKPITGNLDEFERLLKFADNDFFASIASRSIGILLPQKVWP